jgi:hypothetical protein
MKNHRSDNSQVRWKNIKLNINKNNNNTLVASKWNAVNNVDEVKLN